eukprot:5260112-Pleurochrysis_carterae.AAC.3
MEPVRPPTIFTCRWAHLVEAAPRWLAAPSISTQVDAFLLRWAIAPSEFDAEGPATATFTSHVVGLTHASCVTESGVTARARRRGAKMGCVAE